MKSLPGINISRQLTSISSRCKTNMNISKKILDNNKRLCEELNNFFNLEANRYALDNKGNICIKSLNYLGDSFLRPISDDNLLNAIQYMRVKKF